MNKTQRSRLKKKFPCPNPLFVKWLTEWKQDAAEKGLKLQYIYAKALRSLQKYPLPLSSGKEAKILEYFGDKICSMLDAKLIEWRQSSSSQSSSQTSESEASSSSSTVPKRIPVLKSKSPKGVRNTVGMRSAPKVQIVQRRLPAVTQPPVQPPLDTPEVEDHDSFYLFPQEFSVVLCVDNCETLSGHGKHKKLFISELQNCGVEYEVRKLHVGDFLWVARDRRHPDRELVLDFVVERKRMDDLAHSIKDGRFREQKFRMKTSGVRHPVYLVENCSGAKYLGLPESTLEQAIANTQICDGFIVKRTQGVKDSVSYLSLMTKMLSRKYQNQTLASGSREVVQKKTASTNTFMSFSEFNGSSVKNKSLTVKEMLAKHLLQFFGLSVDRAAAIVDQFKTPTELLEAYKSCDSEADLINLISSIKYGMHKKNIGPVLSKSLLQFYSPNSL